ncbi:FMN-dependent dehydrogenase [Dipodascopsis uninucleata]
MPVLNLTDLEEAAKAKCDKMTWDFWSGGANDLLTVSENSEAFLDYRIRPRMLRDVTEVDMKPKRKLFGMDFAVPCGIAPSSMHKLAHPKGEEATAAAVKARNWAMGISSYSNCSLEDAKRAGGDNLVFFQLYVFKNRDTCLDLVRRAEAAGYKGLMVTIDSPYLGLRFAERRNKFAVPPHLNFGNFVGSHYAGPVDFSVEAKSESKGPGANQNLKSKTVKPNVIDPALSWQDIIWLKTVTKLEVWVKGVLTSEDAEMAINAGADGIIVSNHGGRQLDGCLATLHALPEVVTAVKGRIPVHMDGGIRRGSDIFRALALGADFVWVGRPALWGLKYNGQEGVEMMEKFLEDELKLVMALAGCQTVSDITPENLTRKTMFAWAKL